MPLRDYQQEAVDTTIRFFKEKSGNPLIVAPTGSGKSHIISGLIDKCEDLWKGTRFLIVAHRQELIVQNAAKLDALRHDIGIYCAGLKKREVCQITFATVASIHRKTELFAGTNILLIDEAHLLPKKGDGMYRRLIRDLKVFNPKLRVVGLTATPYRLDSGRLDDKDGLFDEIVYDIDLNYLVDEGHLSPVITKGAVEQADCSGLSIRRGDFVKSEMEELFVGIAQKQCEEIIRYGKGRKSWLIFCSGVRHAGLVSELLSGHGISCESVTGHDSADIRGQRLQRFKRSEIQAIANCDILTTGFDAPSVDLIALLRPTQSTGLYVQMVGRGMRCATGKSDCLLLDFGENVVRHGPIDAIDPKRAGSKSQGAEPVKLCGHCRTYNKIAAKSCWDCGSDFTKQCPYCREDVPLREAEGAEDCPRCGKMWMRLRDQGGVTAYDGAAMSRFEEAEWYDVTGVYYGIHKKEGKPDSLKVIYKTDVGEMNKFVCLDHGGFATRMALKWVKQGLWRDGAEAAKGVEGVHDLAMCVGQIMREPKRIKAKKVGRFWEIVNYDYPSHEEWEQRDQEPEDPDELKPEWKELLDSLF